mgnify:CR=1 FL=1
MLLWLTEVLSQYFSALTVFQYLTLRGILGTLTALLISLIIGPVMIRKLSQYQIGQAVRDDGPQTHLSKAGTPTMGGALILVAIGISTLLWAGLMTIAKWWNVTRGACRPAGSISGSRLSALRRPLCCSSVPPCPRRRPCMCPL